MKGCAVFNQNLIDAAHRLQEHHSIDASHEHDCFIVAREYLRLVDAARALAERGYVDRPTQRFIVPVEFVEALRAAP